MKKSDIDGVRIVTHVSKECWKMLKIIGIQKDQTLHDFAAFVLEQYTNKNSKKVTDTIGDMSE